MTNELVNQIMERTKERQLVHFGFVESISGGLASLRLGSTIIDGATWLSGYAPVVGDRVAVLATGAGWLVLDAVEAVQRAYNEPQTITVWPTHIGSCLRVAWSASWDGSLSNPSAPPQLPEASGDPWEMYVRSRRWDIDKYSFQDAGKYFVPSGGGDLVNYVPSNGQMARLLYYPRLSEQVPSNALIQSASLVLRLWDPDPRLNIRETFQPAADAPIRVHPHSQPAPTTSAIQDSGHPPEYYFNDSFSPIDAGAASPGDQVVVPLPGDQVEALANGTLTGLALWPGETDKRIVFADYTEPFRLPSGDWAVDYDAVTCLSLQVTYITPVGED